MFMQKYWVKKGPACSEQRKRGLGRVYIKGGRLGDILFICSHGMATMRTKAHDNHTQIRLCGSDVFCLCYDLLAQRKNEASCRSAEKHVTRTMDRSDIVIETIVIRGLLLNSVT